MITCDYNLSLRQLSSSALHMQTLSCLPLVCLGFFFSVLMTHSLLYCWVEIYITVSCNTPDNMSVTFFLGNLPFGAFSPYASIWDIHSSHLECFVFGSIPCFSLSWFSSLWVELILKWLPEKGCLGNFFFFFEVFMCEKVFILPLTYDWYLALV